MNAQEYQKARREYEGKQACGGCGLFLIIFAVFPVSTVTLGLLPGIAVTAGVFCAFIFGMSKWME